MGLNYFKGNTGEASESWSKVHGTSQACLSIKLCVSDDPHLVSSKHKDVFEDILEDRRHSSDLRYSTRARDVPKFRLNKQRTPQQIKNHVLKSDRVQYAVEQVSV